MSATVAPSQCDRVLEVLADGRPHSVPEIHDRAGTMRLNSRVAELRKRGHNIVCLHRPSHGRGAAAYAYQLFEAPSQPGPAPLPLPAGPGLPPRQAGTYVEPDELCGACGHAAYTHAIRDCLHRNEDGRFLCPCEGFEERDDD